MCVNNISISAQSPGHIKIKECQPGIERNRIRVGARVHSISELLLLQKKSEQAIQSLLQRGAFEQYKYKPVSLPFSFPCFQFFQTIIISKRRLTLKFIYMGTAFFRWILYTTMSFLKRSWTLLLPWFSPHFGFGGWKEHYTGYCPVWQLSYVLPFG